MSEETYIDDDAWESFFKDITSAIYDAMHDALKDALPSPDPTWPDAHCADCGYPRLTLTEWHKDKKNTSRLCRKHGCEVWRHTQACPAIVRRAKEKE